MSCTKPEVAQSLPARAQSGFERYLSPKYTDYKAFAVDLRTGSWGSTYQHNSLQAAIDRALIGCGRRSADCQIYAIGNTVVSGMTPNEVAALIQNSYLSLDQQAYQEYLSKTAYPDFKAFALDIHKGAWGRAWGYYSPERAKDRALRECRILGGVDCRIYAIGEILVSAKPKDELKSLTKEYVRNILGNAGEAQRLARNWKGEIILGGIRRTLTGSPFEADWEGTIHCGNCQDCAGPITRNMKISIANSEFDIAYDRIYKGIGLVDDAGNMSIRWGPNQGNIYDWGRHTIRKFHFDGKYDGRSFTLRGERGSRSCVILLERVVPSS